MIWEEHLKKHVPFQILGSSKTINAQIRTSSGGKKMYFVVVYLDLNSQTLKLVLSDLINSSGTMSKRLYNSN